MQKWFLETVLKGWVPTVVGLVSAGAMAAGEVYVTGNVSKEGMMLAAAVAVIGAVKKSKKKTQNNGQ